MRPALEGKNLKIGPESPCLSGRRHTGGVPADDEQSLFPHSRITSIGR
jgi:hypothetical protein